MYKHVEENHKPTELQPNTRNYNTKLNRGHTLGDWHSGVALAIA